MSKRPAADAAFAARAVDETQATTRGGIQVIERAASILRALKDEPSGMSLGQIADVVGLPRSTVQRIANAMQKERLVAAGPNGGGLRLGPELGALAKAAQLNIVESCRLLLTELARATGETADLAVLRGASMVFLDQAPGTHRLRTVSSVGEVFPLTTTANGRACLAKLPADQAVALIELEWTRLGADRDMPAFLRELDTVRQTGLAYDLDEHTAGISAIGLAFADWSGDVHSISVPVPSTRFEAVRGDIEAALKETQRRIDAQFVR